MMNIKPWLAVCAFSALLTACASGSHIITGVQRPAIDPQLVKVFSKAPSQSYEIIGTVEATSSRGVTQQERLASAVATLKNEAAELGANGVIVNNLENNQTGGVTPRTRIGISTGTGGFRTGVSTGIIVNPASVTGTAIYLLGAPTTAVPLAE